MARRVLTLQLVTVCLAHKALGKYSSSQRLFYSIVKSYSQIFERLVLQCSLNLLLKVTLLNLKI